MEFNKDRILIGILIFLSCVFFYIFQYDYIFFGIISLFIFLDLKSLLFKYKKTYYIFIILCCITVYNFFTVSNIYFFLILILIFLTFIFQKYISIIFTTVIFIFAFLLFYLIDNERNIFFLIFFISFFNDTLAYFFGSLFKGPLILPSISPKKTWSGTLISFFLSTAVLWYVNYTFILASLLSISLFLGDIYFSYIKRKLNLKDFSNTLSSHGGILDRLDSMFLITIIIAFISHNL